MTLAFSEIVYPSPNPSGSAQRMVSGFGWEVVESFGESWVLLATPGGGRVGFIQQKPGSDSMPVPMAAFESQDIETDVAELRANGIDLPDPSGPGGPGTLRHTTYADPDGNRFLIWQSGKD
ncbi:MAG: VOC family protein [Armatimonadetes bacterium]|nr:VOC family protein [Armatimonadota bacterium]MBS1711703.1 VOC family protein [Armatimonadota bacterium]MBX3109742.1 VOC family protein [Fimbriimonadaceae bacterium]